MRDHDRGQSPSRRLRRFITRLMLGRFERRIEALEAEAERLACRVAELERTVSRQDARLKVLAALVPFAARNAGDEDASSSTSVDRRTMH